jgi:hypothetical protein
LPPSVPRRELPFTPSTPVAAAGPETVRTPSNTSGGPGFAILSLPLTVIPRATA